MALILQQFLQEWPTLRPSAFAPVRFGRGVGVAPATLAHMEEILRLQGVDINDGLSTFILAEQVIPGIRPFIHERVFVQPVAASRPSLFQIPFDLVERRESTLVANPIANIPTRKVSRPQSTEERLALLGVNTLKGFGTVLNKPGPQTRLAMARLNVGNVGNVGQRRRDWGLKR